jgi:hypothetical protein
LDAVFSVCSAITSGEAALPQYYFHVYNDDVLRDQTGEEFIDADAARQAALRGISELVAENIVQGKLVDLSDRIDIADEHGQVVSTIRFGELFSESAVASAR